MSYQGPYKFCLHGIETSAMSMCPKCEEDRKAGRSLVVICPHHPEGRPPNSCAACENYVPPKTDRKDGADLI